MVRSGARCTSRPARPATSPRLRRDTRMHGQHAVFHGLHIMPATEAPCVWARTTPDRHEAQGLDQLLPLPADGHRGALAEGPVRDIEDRSGVSPASTGRWT